MNSRRVYQDQLHVHFITFSCYKRRKHLDTQHAKQIVIGNLASCLSKQDGLCIGFVIMPDHVHALVWFPEINQLSKFMNKWKELSSRHVKTALQNHCPNYWKMIDSSEPIWQPRYYGFNIWSRRKVEEKIDYMHLNPVRVGIVEKAFDWKWSSARWYLDSKFVGIDIKWPPGLEHDDEFDTYLG